MRALGVHVQISSHHFLASAGLAGNENGHFLVCHLPHHMPNTLHLVALADERAKHIVIAHIARLAEAPVMLSIDFRLMQCV